MARFDQVAPRSGFGAAPGMSGFWNGISALGVTSNLIDLGGNITNASIDVKGGYLGYSQTPILPLDGDANLLLQDQLQSVPRERWSVTLTGLADGTYTVYLYGSPKDLVSPSIDFQLGDGTANGVPFSTIAAFTSPWSGVFTEGVTHRRVEGVHVSGGILFIQGIGSYFSGPSGVQLLRTGP